MNGLLPQGVGMAATAVEKCLKGVLLIKGNRCNGHLEKNLINAIKNQQPKLYDDLNVDFIKFLRKAYKLRYYDDKKDRFSIVINQFRTLAELDKNMSVIDSGVVLSKNGVTIESVYVQGLKKKEQLLMESNYIALGLDRGKFMKRRNKVLELSIEPDTNGLNVSYETGCVNDSGSFLKPVEISTKAKVAQLTFG